MCKRKLICTMFLNFEGRYWTYGAKSKYLHHIAQFLNLWSIFLNIFTFLAFIMIFFIHYNHNSNQVGRRRCSFSESLRITLNNNMKTKIILIIEYSCFLINKILHMFQHIVTCFFNRLARFSD